MITRLAFLAKYGQLTYLATSRRNILILLEIERHLFYVRKNRKIITYVNMWIRAVGK